MCLHCTGRTGAQVKADPHRLLTKWVLHLSTCLGQEVILLCSLGTTSTSHASFMVEVAQAVTHWVLLVTVKSFTILSLGLVSS